MDVEQLRDEVRQGRNDTDRLVNLVVTLSREAQHLEQRIKELEENLGGSPVRSEENRQEERGNKPPRPKGKPRRRGRIRTADRNAKADRIVCPANCQVDLVGGRRAGFPKHTCRNPFAESELQPSERHQALPCSVGATVFELKTVAYQWSPQLLRSHRPKRRGSAREPASVAPSSARID